LCLVSSRFNKNKDKNVVRGRIDKKLFSCSTISNTISNGNSICDRECSGLKGIDHNINIEVVNNKENNNRNISMSNINHLVEKENIILSKKNNNKYLGGFTSYNNVVLLNNFIFTFNPDSDKICIDRESLLLSVRNFLSKLDDNLTYSVLFSGKSSNGENIQHTISKSSLIIHKIFLSVL